MRITRFYTVVLYFCLHALILGVSFGITYAQKPEIFEVTKLSDLSTLSPLVRKGITSIPEGAEIILSRDYPYRGQFIYGTLKYKNVSVSFDLLPGSWHSYENALHIVNDYIKITPEISQLLKIPIPAKQLDIHPINWSFGEGTSYLPNSEGVPDVLKITQTYEGGAKYKGALAHELGHFFDQYCPTAATRKNNHVFCEMLTTEIGALYDPAQATLDNYRFADLYDPHGNFKPAAFKIDIANLLNPEVYRGGLNEGVYWSSRILMEELKSRSGLSGDQAITYAKDLVNKARSVTGIENVAHELKFASSEELTMVLQKRFLATQPMTIEPFPEAPPSPVYVDQPLYHQSQKELVASINKNAKANAQLFPPATPTKGVGMRTFVRRAGAVVGIAGTIMALHDISTTSADERVVKGFLEQMRQCTNSLPGAPNEGFWEALKDQFPEWSMNLGFDDVGRMVMGKDFDEKFAREFADGMAYIQKNCPSVWNGIRVSPKLAPFRQATLDWIGRIPEIHGELKTEMSSRPASWSDYLPWNRSPAEKKNPRPSLFRGRDIAPPFEGVMMP